MNFRYGHLCDYAGIGNGGKLILIGLFDSVFTVSPDGPIRVPRSFLVFRAECSVAEGTQHEVTLRLLDADMTVLMALENIAAQFVTSGPGRPLGANIIAELEIEVPGIGDYTFEVVVDGRVLGELPLYVLERAQPPAA